MAAEQAEPAVRLTSASWPEADSHGQVTRLARITQEDEEDPGNMASVFASGEDECGSDVQNTVSDVEDAEQAAATNQPRARPQDRSQGRSMPAHPQREDSEQESDGSDMAMLQKILQMQMEQSKMMQEAQATREEMLVAQLQAQQQTMANLMKHVEAQLPPTKTSTENDGSKADKYGPSKLRLEGQPKWPSLDKHMTQPVGGLTHSRARRHQT